MFVSTALLGPTLFAFLKSAMSNYLNLETGFLKIYVSSALIGASNISKGLRIIRTTATYLIRGPRDNAVCSAVSLQRHTSRCIFTCYTPRHIYMPSKGTFTCLRAHSSFRFTRHLFIAIQNYLIFNSHLSHSRNHQDILNFNLKIYKIYSNKSKNVSVKMINLRNETKHKPT